MPLNEKKRGRPLHRKNAPGHKAGRPRKDETRSTDLPKGQQTLNFNKNGSNLAEPIEDFGNDQDLYEPEIVVPETNDSAENQSTTDIATETEQQTAEVDNNSADMEFDDDYVDETAPIPEDDLPEGEESDSVLKKYFLELQRRFQEKDNGYPREYRNGTFWVTPKDPYFALMDNLDPDELYKPRVFLWFPHLLVKNFESLKCTLCKSNLKVKGYTKTPCARRVVDLDSCFYIMGMRYECTKKECGATIISNDPDIIRQLPYMLQCEYPGYMTHRCGLAKTVGDLYRPCVQNSVGPKRFQKILREMHWLKYSRRKFQYYQAVLFRRLNPTVSQTGNNNDAKRFSDFNDQSKYAGRIPSPQYFRTFYTVFIGEIRRLLDRQIEILDGVYLKGDHTFKLIKLMSKINGQQAFAALYTVLNEYEEVRLQFLVPSKALYHLQYAFDAMHALPSLTKDVTPVIEKEPEAVLNARTYPLLQIPDHVGVHCIRNPEEIDSSVTLLLRQAEASSSIGNGQSEYKSQAIGLDCEWPFKRGNRRGKVATIQLAYDDTVLVCCVSQCDKLPTSLSALLSSNRILKVGRNVSKDLSNIEEDFNIRCKGACELGAFCKSQGAIQDGRMGLKNMCEVIFGRTLYKGDDVRQSSWDALDLTEDQVHYAALDAWASLQVFEEVRSHGVIGLPISQPTEGTDISFHPGRMKDAAAYGEIAKQYNELNGVQVKKNQVIITVKRVLIPAAIADEDSDESIDGECEDDIEAIDDEENIQVLSSGIHEESQQYGHRQFQQLRDGQHTSPNSTSGPIRSRILKDIFHLMDIIKVSKKHGLSKIFSRAFRDALFIIDKSDKEKVKKVLAKQGTTWNKKLGENPNWIFRRVRRVVPPPEELYPTVKKLFETYGPLICARTGRPLFDYDNWRQAKNVLTIIHQGHVSDPPGIPFYFVKGKDKDGLTLYRCTRGTNSLEGGIHQNLIRSFGSFGASVELVESALADYRLRHNTNAGSLNRYGRVHDGHYDPWLDQYINELEIALNIQVPRAQYKFIAARQKAAHALVPVHTPSEKDLFTDLLDKHFPHHKSKSVDYVRLTKIWSQHVNGTEIFYKAPEHLRSRHNLTKEKDNTDKTIKNNKEELDEMRNTLNSSSRKRAAPSPQQQQPYHQSHPALSTSTQQLNQPIQYHTQNQGHAISQQQQSLFTYQQQQQPHYLLQQQQMHLTNFQQQQLPLPQYTFVQHPSLNPYQPQYQTHTSFQHQLRNPSGIHPNIQPIIPKNITSSNSSASTNILSGLRKWHEKTCKICKRSDWNGKNKGAQNCQHMCAWCRKPNCLGKTSGAQYCQHIDD
ncbi:hypothetical protein BDB00DRAFT_877589 [Zychaea mexicana]|uniref:uncharacterized protein n=1 Tax=Zychaea mexicana TaxID=64656 RepID=UPI0022FE5E3A|nr:uncharacterized protein BDB00DRAFT_877589 [Zychaea mexicana]KAI9488288.1 hypothetical protein BDB00DRAFT_877589 [Zychaea mexicana]